MNPSASGWIEKFGHLAENGLWHPVDFDELYQQMKSTGFIYGVNVGTIPFVKTQHVPSQDENAKINLLSALYFTYHLSDARKGFRPFLDCIFGFYKVLNVGKISLFNKLLTGRKTSAQLERLLDSRIYLEDNLISKTFNSIITNSLLFIDVLTFKRYLESKEDIREYAQQLESILINLTYHTLNSKEKNKKDEKLAQLFEASLTFVDFQHQHFDGSYRDRLLHGFNAIENQYFLDMACLTVWEDQSLDYKESDFIFGIGQDMDIPKNKIVQSLEDVTDFFDQNAQKIPHLKDNNLAHQFYDSMAKIVDRLILRNSKRLQKELSESKELVYLLSKSTTKDLSPSEKRKVQNQLLDIFKSIPSLAIFILPGGAVLLPIFIKLIPKLLPSSFDENRVEKRVKNP